MKFFMITLLTCVITLSYAQDELVQAFSKSYELEQYKSYNQAIEQLTKNYNAASYEINVRLGWLSHLAGDFVKSSNYYKKAIELESSSIEARMGLVYPVAAMENWNKVIEIYKEVLNIDPNNTIANYRLGSIYYYRKQYSTAAGYVEKVIKLYPFDYDSAILLAQIYTSLGNIIEARALYTKALLYSPTDQTAKQGLEKLK